MADVHHDCSKRSERLSSTCDAFDQRRCLTMSARDYAQTLRPWLLSCYTFSTISQFMLRCPFPNFPPPITNSQQLRNFHPPISTRSNTNVQTESVHDDRSREVVILFRIPPLWKRALAEFIDFTVFFQFKDVFFQFDLFFTEDDPNVDLMLNFAYEMVILEIINRLIVALFETMCLKLWCGVTPGKRMMKLHVVSCTWTNPFAGARVLVYPAGNISWASACIRSMVKSALVFVLWPFFLSVFMYPYNRTLYDEVSSTIVVEIRRP